MGLQGLSQFLKRYKNISRTLTPVQHIGSYDHILVDMNAMLFSRRPIGSLLKKFTNEMKVIRGRVLCSKSLFFSADGVAPLGKIFLQRNRRKDDSFLRFTVGSQFLSDIDNGLEKMATKFVNSI